MITKHSEIDNLFELKHLYYFYYLNSYFPLQRVGLFPSLRHPTLPNQAIYSSLLNYALPVDVETGSGAIARYRQEVCLKVFESNLILGSSNSIKNNSDDNNHIRIQYYGREPLLGATVSWSAPQSAHDWSNQPIIILVLFTVTVTNINRTRLIYYHVAGN